MTCVLCHKVYTRLRERVVMKDQNLQGTHPYNAVRIKIYALRPWKCTMKLLLSSLCALFFLVVFFCLCYFIHWLTVFLSLHTPPLLTQKPIPFSSFSIICSLHFLAYFILDASPDVLKSNTQRATHSSFSNLRYKITMFIFICPLIFLNNLTLS